MYKSFNNQIKTLISHLNFNEFKTQVKKYSDFPLINLPNALLDNLLIVVFVFMISSFYGGNYLGFYAITLRVLKTPLGIIGNSTGYIFLQKASSMHAEGQSIEKLFLKSFGMLFLIGIVVFLPIIFFGEHMFSIFFGSSWAESGRLAGITSVWLFLSFIASGLSNLPVVMRKQKIVFAMALINFFLINSTLFICYKMGLNFFESFKWISIIESGYFIFVLLWYYNIAKTKSIVDEYIIENASNA